MEKKYFVLHGHFYQPPRENPWTGFIDRQPSAYPFNDWNTRIDIECYTSCTRTSVMEHNQIIKTMNCYEYLSFNFGATLLSWMEMQGNTRTLRKLVEADKISMTRNNGHGNAIAQVYNHLIMPLASEKDQYTQILWGLNDFKMRFGRDSEGFWLSETAINNETAAIMVDCGIKYVILSPYQAHYVIKDQKQYDVLGGRIDPSVPYKIKTKNGDLTAFFYDGALAAGISFGDLLTSADNLKGAVNSAFNALADKKIKLVHTATDGEVYGHHKYHGNMALARMIYDVTQQNNPEFEFINYGKFLAENPAQDECILHLGDDNLGSSWSCAHGVGRWSRDCSCHTGGQEGWNQKWRTPLREALDFLRDSIQEVAEERSKNLVKNIWDARNDFLQPLHSNNLEVYHSFLLKHQIKELSTQEAHEVITILEALRYAMLMYTSCGWFFSDLSGIETTQILVYAQIAYEYMKEFLPDDTYQKYIDILASAQSNINGNGKEILERTINESRLTIDILKEFLFWVLVRDENVNLSLLTQSLSMTKIWSDPSKKRFLYNISNFTGMNTYTAFTLVYTDGIVNKYIAWKDFKGELSEDELNSESFWEHDNTWVVSTLFKLPTPLKLSFIANSIKYEMQSGHDCLREEQSSFLLDAIWGIEEHLLPYERRVLVFHYATQVYRFAQNLVQNESLIYHTELFLREAELLKKSSSSLEEAQLYLEPVAMAFGGYLQKSLDAQDAVMLKNAHVIYWAIRDCVHARYIDQFRDIMYTFQNHKNHIINSSPMFAVEFKSLMGDLGFR